MPAQNWYKIKLSLMAIEKAYLQVEKIKFKNKYYRTDIAAKAFGT